MRLEAGPASPSHPFRLEGVGDRAGWGVISTSAGSATLMRQSVSLAPTASLGTVSSNGGVRCRCYFDRIRGGSNRPGLDGALSFTALGRNRGSSEEALPEMGGKAT